MIQRRFLIKSEYIVIPLFFLLFIIVQRTDNIYTLVAYTYGGIALLHRFFLKKKDITNNARRLLSISLFFWFQEFSSAQENSALKIIIYASEIALLLYFLLHTTIRRNKIDRKQNRVILLLAGFVIANFTGCMFTYGNILIFLYSTYDSCKYFLLLMYIMSLKLSREEFVKYLELMASVIIVNAIISALQFTGVSVLFDVFRGHYKIVTRIGSFRAIGMFPYGIELGNYSSILFALYYNCSKMAEKRKRKVYYLVEACLVICAILSGTRTSLAIIGIILILSDISNMKSWLRTGAVIIALVLFTGNLVDLKQMISRTRWDVSIELPRKYYFMKGLAIWREHPLFGIGYNTYASMKYRKRTNDIIFNQYNVHAFDYANLATSDSFLSELIPEFGLVGMFLIILFAVWIIRSYRAKKHDKYYYRGQLIAIISIFVMTFNSSTALISPHIGGWFWIACGIIL